MSDDLISRSALLEELSGFSVNITGLSNTVTRLIMEETKKSIVDMVSKQPTAYDVDKVIEKIKEEKIRNAVLYGKCTWAEDAIEIVRTGGANE